MFAETGRKNWEQSGSVVTLFKDGKNLGLVNFDTAKSEITQVSSCVGSPFMPVVKNVRFPTFKYASVTRVCKEGNHEAHENLIYFFSQLRSSPV